VDRRRLMGPTRVLLTESLEMSVVANLMNINGLRLTRVLLTFLESAPRLRPAHEAAASRGEF